jgi:tetratricopeptide (TPR) repeat protein
MSSCPPDEKLQLLGAVSMSETDFVSLEKHIQECGDCQAALERLARDVSQGEAGSFIPLSEPQEAPPVPGFVLEHELGRGSMGVVYLAWQPNLARHVAIKFLRRGAADGPEERDRWLREAQSLSRVRNRGIVQIFQIGEAEGWLYLVLELIRGGSLKDRLTKPLPARLAARFAETMALAVDEIHKAGLLHLDLKPSNILLDSPPDGSWEQMTPMIGDFGIARLRDDPHSYRNGAPVVCGTPSYMAPEQIKADRGAMGPPADIYAVGATLYHLLTGRPPFLAATVNETYDQVCHRDTVSPRALVPSVPRDLETICLKCLQKSPQDRYLSAAALADDLRRFQNGEPVKARRLGLPGRAWLWCRRKPGTASLVAVLLLALLGGITGIALQWSRAEAARRSALASDVEAQELLSELIQSNPVLPMEGYRPVAPSIESLLKAEAHCRNLLRKHGGEITLRIALTKVYGQLATLYVERGQKAEADASIQAARGLWESAESRVASNPACRDWLATTYTWQGSGDDIPRYFQLLQRADAIWQKLADEQPGNLDLMHKIWACRIQMTGCIATDVVRDDCLRLLEESRQELDRLVRQNSTDRTVRKRLALTCFLLGEIYSRKGAAAKASSCWRESFEHYNILAAGSCDNLLGDILLAISCSRLIERQSTDPYYLQAVRLLEQAGRSLNALSKEEPQRGWLQELLLEDYCYLALCHAKAGETARAEQTANDQVCVLATPLDAERIEPGFALERATRLVAFGQLLREAKQPAAALRLARRAGAVSSQLAVWPSRDPIVLYDLSGLLTGCSALANQLGDPALSLQQAELGRHTIEELIRTAPDGFRHEDMLSLIWERIAKAHWGLGERVPAVAALRESAAIQKRVFEREPSNHACRTSLSRCYDRLVFYGSSGGDLRGAADAILDRTKLWPDDAGQLAKTAEDFDGLAKRVTARNGGQLSSDDQAERDRYLAESRRFRQAAGAATGRVGHDLRVER